jgi:arylsulfatase
MALRVGDYKLGFEMQRAVTTNVWAEPFVKLRLPHIFHLRRDPFERADFNSNVYWDWLIDHAPMLYLAQDVVARQIEDFVKYPPRQKAASFNLDSVMEQLKPAMQAERAKETAEKQKAETARAR